MLTATSPLKRVDSPEVIRDNSMATLSFKEVRDSLFKFLMQAEIPFSGAERLPISVRFPYKEVGSTEKLSFELNNHVNYRVACKLRGLTVGGKPVHIVAVPFGFDELSKSERCKILSLQGMFNIVVFDAYDWKKLGLDISDKQWLKPLTGKVLKSWARILFSKISSLDGEVASDYSLNDLFSNIDRNVQNTTVAKSNERVQKLTSMVISKELELLGHKDLTLVQRGVLKSIVSLNKVSASWLEDTFSDIVTVCLKSIDMKKKVYKSMFLQANGVSNPINAEKLGQLVYDYIKVNKRTLNVEVLGPGILRLQHKRTFQQAVIVLSPTVSSRGTISVDTSSIKRTKQDLGFIFEIKFTKSKAKVEDVSIFSVLVGKSSETKYGRKDRLPIVTSLKKGCDLWIRTK